MISLSTTQSLKIVTGQAKNIDVLAAWVDTADDLPASSETLISSATTETIVAAPYLLDRWLLQPTLKWVKGASDLYAGWERLTADNSSSYLLFESEM